MYIIDKGSAPFFLSGLSVFIEPFYQRCPGFLRKDCRRLLVGDVKNTLCLDGIGSLERVGIPLLCLLRYFRDKEEFKKLISAFAVGIDIQIYGLVAVLKLLEADADRYRF